jgi:hypothetical protein
MQECGLSPNEYTYSSVLSVIAGLRNLQEGQQVHTQLKVISVYNLKPSNIYSLQDKYGELVHFPTAVANSLITMYAKCNDLQSARQVSHHSLSVNFIDVVI